MAYHEALRRVICPSAPFLVPSRSLVTLRGRPQWLFCSIKDARHVSSAHATEARTVRPRDYSRGESQRTLDRSNDAGLTKKRSSGSKERKRRLNAAYRGHESEKGGGTADGRISNFRASLACGQLDEALQLYPSALNSHSLAKEDTRALAQLLHSKWRRGASVGQKDTIMGIAKDIVSDLRRGRLPLDNQASVHLLSLFKEAKQYDEGVRLWSWLASQSEEEVDMRVYGAAIELLSYCGESLPNLEALYSTALKRFPENFNEYHLSPHAILTDRSQPTITSGTSMTLLQGILTARLLHGDWQNAYLALDTALRLYPTQVPPRMFEVFVYERPLNEAFHVFLLSCRAGTVLNPQVLTFLLGKMVNAEARERTETRLAIAEGMLKALYAHAGASGALQVLHLNYLIRGIFGLLPKMSPMASGNDSMIFDAIVLTQKAISTFGHLGVKPIISTYNNLISLASELHSPTLLNVAVQGFTLNRLTPDKITYRALLATAGSFGNKEQVEESWKVLVDTALAEGRQPELTDWVALAKAANDAHCVGYALKQLEELEPVLTPTIKTAFSSILDRVAEEAPAREPNIIKDILPRFEAFEKMALSILGRIKAKSSLDLNEYPRPMTLFRSVLSVPEHLLRSLYDELSTESQMPSVDTSPKQGPRPMSATGLPLGELRYGNWKDINELLAEAEKTDIARRAAVDEAIRSGTPSEVSKSDQRNFPSPDHSQDVYSGSVGAEETWVDKILRLRALDRTQLHRRRQIEALKERMVNAESEDGRRALDSNKAEPSRSGLGSCEFARTNEPADAIQTSSAS